jgi:hypothetical protein
MEKEFIPYEQALALKELEFDEPCFGYYKPNGELDYIENHILKDFPYLAKNSEWQDLVAAPLYQQAFKWFREKYQIDSCIHRNGGMNIDERGFLPYYEVIIRYKSPELKCVKYSHEEAELECLKKLIEIVKQKDE